MVQFLLARVRNVANSGAAVLDLQMVASTEVL